MDIYSDQKSLQYVFTQKDLNLKQKIWLKLFKYYDVSFHYQLGKANMVPDALYRLSIGSLWQIEDKKREPVKDIHWLSILEVWLLDFKNGRVAIHEKDKSSLGANVKEK